MKIKEKSLHFITALVVLISVTMGGCVRGDGDQAPEHYFIPADSRSEKIVWCSFKNDLDRSEMPSLWEEPPQPCSLGSGWTNPTGGGVVALAPTSTFDIALPSENYSHLLLTVKAFRGSEEGQRQTITIDVNGRNLGTADVPEDWTTVGFSVPNGTLRQGPNRISAVFGHRISPASVEEENKKDDRLFAIHLREAAFVRSDDPNLSPGKMKRLMSSSSSHPAPAGTAVRFESGFFVVRHPGTLVFPMDIPVDGEFLEIEAQSRSAKSADNPQISLKIQSLVSDAHQTTVSASEGGNGRSRKEVLKIPLTDFAGHQCAVIVDLPVRSDTNAVTLSPPRIIRGHADNPATTSSARTEPADQTRPDIVMITLDAARADHFSCYGYHRKTTPNIDRLAEGSQVFRSAFALAPYTLCSVPTMVTGLSNLDHQVTQHKDSLADGATTLAEYLKSEGYRTACFSATPNNSRALNTDQGYDRFVEAWKIVPQKDSIDPFLLSEMASQWLAEQEGDMPIHLQLHFVPPHAPYQPSPEFDVFSDPAYHGGYDGTHKTLAAMDSGWLRPNPEDLQHVVDLYDGNLLAADAAVGQVLAALEKRERWNKTVVLIVSDHGEAFLEHGRTEHNSTVFDEMLHVPFILRLPPAFHLPVNPALDQLVTLADIVPTLLATAVIEPDPDLAGINLLRESGGRGSGSRYFVARTTGDSPIYALRSPRWKLMLAGSGQGALFDLERDPGETDDVVFTDRATFYTLGRLLTARVAEPPRFEPIENDQRLTGKDAEMLKKLGYLQ